MLYLHLQLPPRQQSLYLNHLKLFGLQLPRSMPSMLTQLRLIPGGQSMYYQRPELRLLFYFNRTMCYLCPILHPPKQHLYCLPYQLSDSRLEQQVPDLPCWLQPLQRRLRDLNPQLRQLFLK